MAEWAEESAYEKERKANIAANAEMLLALGLNTATLTQQAVGPKAPLRQRSRPLRHRRPAVPDEVRAAQEGGGGESRQ